MSKIFFHPPESSSKELLAACDLPISDLEAGHFDHFLGYGTEESLQGLVGVELFESNGQLRSLAVAEEARGSGAGKALLNGIERYAQERGVQTLYLLTTTAEAFFARNGYAEVSRDVAPESIRQTPEFAGICPDNATFMMKTLLAE